MPPLDVPGWLPGRTWYHVHALRATGAPDVNPDPAAPTPTGHALRALTAQLDRIDDLGFGGLLLTPVAASSTHGYDTVEPLRIDPRLGDDDDFDALVDACRARDIRVVLDGVLNHVGRSFPPFVDVVERGRASPYATWFRLDFDGHGADGFTYRDFEGHRELVALNHDEPAVLEWAAAVCRHWLDRGVDGWRFDVAYAIAPSFFAALVSRLRRDHADAFLFGEMIHGDYSAFVTASGLSGVTQYELHKACWSACNDRNLFELAWSLGRHAEMSSSGVPVTFGGNHDVTRMASLLADRSHLGVVLAVLFTVPGTPCVYYGDEWGATGVKVHGSGGDDAVRPRFDELVADAATEELHRRWIRFRRDRPWLTAGRLEVGAVTNEQLSYVVQEPGSDRAVAVALDLRGDGAVPVPPEGSDWRPVDAVPGVWERGSA